MTAQDWRTLYERLCGGLSRRPDPAQERAYYDALSRYPVAVVSEAVRQACAKTWPPTHPHAGDLVELASVEMRGRVAPASTCGVCGGGTWMVHHCAGVSAPDNVTPPAPVDRAHCCGRTYVHADHDYATRCPQCWVLGAA